MLGVVRQGTLERRVESARLSGRSQGITDAAERLRDAGHGALARMLEKDLLDGERSLTSWPKVGDKIVLLRRIAPDLPAGTPGTVIELSPTHSGSDGVHVRYLVGPDCTERFVRTCFGEFAVMEED